MTGRAAETADVETASDVYASRFEGSAGRWFLRVQAETVRGMLDGLPPGGSVLDVGGGHAQLTPLLLELGFAVTILGSRTEAEGRAAPFVSSGSVRFETGDLLAPPFPERSFDAVLSFRLLPHLHDPDPLIPALCRLARDRVILDYPSTRSVNRFAESTYGWKKGVEKTTRTFALFAPGEIEAAFAAAGFRIACARPQFLLPMVLHRMHRSALLGRLLEAPGRWVGLTGRYGSPVIVQAVPA
ncbi:MAG: methyltransferase domain-containing protein [Candidatus Eisenbacteria bacterium]|nr:methyltransferase domain-containing protein [Candidatus Latescibacterota bacterium]MBD3301928.1 methyltransferase domain-containing protein [Candidatus Eisenbacteria bacterium]